MYKDKLAPPWWDAECEEANKFFWKNYCSEVNKNTSVREIWNQAKRRQRISLNCRKCENTEWVESFLNRIAPCSLTNDTREIYENHCNESDTIFYCPIKSTEVTWALTNSNNSAPGYNNITYSMLWNLPNNSLSLVKL